MKCTIVVLLLTVALAHDGPNDLVKEPYEHPARPHSFTYAVKDVPSSNDYGHQETNDGKVVSGSYHVLLPDGRMQSVNYKVEGHSGYVVDLGEVKSYERSFSNGLAGAKNIVPKYSIYHAPAPAASINPVAAVSTSSGPATSAYAETKPYPSVSPTPVTSTDYTSATSVYLFPVSSTNTAPDVSANPYSASTTLAHPALTTSTDSASAAYLPPSVCQPCICHK